MRRSKIRLRSELAQLPPSLLPPSLSFLLRRPSFLVELTGFSFFLIFLGATASTSTLLRFVSLLSPQLLLLSGALAPCPTQRRPRAHLPSFPSSSFPSYPTVVRDGNYSFSFSLSLPLFTPSLFPSSLSSQADHLLPLSPPSLRFLLSPKPSLNPKPSPSTSTTPHLPTRTSSSGNRSRSTRSEDWEPRRSFIPWWSCSSMRTRRC